MLQVRFSASAGSERPGQLDDVPRVELAKTALRPSAKKASSAGTRLNSHPSQSSFTLAASPRQPFWSNLPNSTASTTRASLGTAFDFGL